MEQIGRITLCILAAVHGGGGYGLLYVCVAVWGAGGVGYGAEIYCSPMANVMLVGSGVSSEGLHAVSREFDCQFL